MLFEKQNIVVQYATTTSKLLDTTEIITIANVKNAILYTLLTVRPTSMCVRMNHAEHSIFANGGNYYVCEL